MFTKCYKGVRDSFLEPMAGADFSYSRMAFYGIMLLYGFFMEHIFIDARYFVGLKAEMWKPVGLFSFFPYFSISLPVAQALKVAWFLVMFCCAVGFCWRMTSKIAFCLTLFLFGYIECFGKVFNNYHMTVLFMGVLCIVRYPGQLSLDHLFGKRLRGGEKYKGLLRRLFAESPEKSGEYRWAIQTALLCLCLSYLAAATQKLRYSGLDWFLKDNLRAILLTRTYGLPPLGQWILGFPMLTKLLSLSTILVQLLSVLALFRFRYSWVFLGCCFWFHIIGCYFLIGMDMAFTKHWMCYVLFVPRLAPWFILIFVGGVYIKFKYHFFI